MVKKIIKLTFEQYEELFTNGEITIDGVIHEFDASGATLYYCPQALTNSSIGSKLDLNNSLLTLLNGMEEILGITEVSDNE